VNLRLLVASIHVPAALRRRGLEELARRTARAFEAEAPGVAGRPLAEGLRRYALYTRERADLVAASADGAARARVRLRGEAQEMGAALRRRLGVSSRAEAMRAVRILYRALGVDLVATPAGSVTVRACSFSATYTCRTCEVMAAMDEGLFEGLIGPGQLAFTARITGGADRCLATFTSAGPSR
jgi:predicted ArsR family transcriptional regulator